MRVALVTEWLDAWRGGAETSTLQFIHHLLEAGVEIDVLTRSRPSPVPGMLVRTISGASMSRTRQSMTFARRAERIVRGGGYDVIHAISPCLPADVYQPRGGTVAETLRRNVALRRNAASRGVKRCLSHLNFKQRYLLQMERRILRESDAVIVAISDYVHRQLWAHYAVPDDRIVRIYNGVNEDDTSPTERARHRDQIRDDYGIPRDDLLVLVIAHNFRLKGVDRWMEAQSLLLKRGHRNIRSMVVGKGDSEVWRRLAVRLGIRDHLVFTGPTDRAAHFRHAGDVLVHPTFYDPCSRVVLEGLASGMPCITTRWDGAAEMIEDGVSGFVLEEPGDAEAIADRVETLRDPDLRKRFAQAARAVAPRIGMERHAREMLALYERVAGKVPQS